VNRTEAHISVGSADNNAVDLLQTETGLSKQRIKQAMSKGAVWLTRGKQTQRLRRAKRPLNAGDELHLYYDAKILSEVPPEPLLIVDEGEFSVWDKPYGLRSQGSKWGDHCTVVRWAEQHLRPERNGFTVHRLDRAANGLILIAHSKRTAGALAALFRDRAIKKRYRALVVGDFSIHNDPIRVETPLDGKESISEFSLLGVNKNLSQSLLDVTIETGRKHQIRRHLAKLGHPVVGDRLYAESVDHNSNLQLSAYFLSFVHPSSGERVDYCLGETRLPSI